MRRLLIACLVLVSSFLLAAPRVIIKFDDLSLSGSKCSGYNVMDYLIEKQVKFSFGAIANTFNSNSYPVLLPYLNAKNDHGDRLFEVWHHGYDHIIPEFEQQTLDYQRQHFSLADKLFKRSLKTQLTTFGAPGNANDSITNLVLAENTFYHVYYFCKQKPSNSTDDMFYIYHRVDMENGVGNVNYDYFVNNYQLLKNRYTDYIALQAHPNGWDSSKQSDFKRIIDYLLAEGAEFVLPFDYFCEQRFTNILKLHGNSADSTRVDLKWEDPNKLAGVEYQIERSEDSIHWYRIALVPVVSYRDSLERQFTDTELEKGNATCYYRVGPNAGLNKSWSNVVKIDGVRPSRNSQKGKQLIATTNPINNYACLKFRLNQPEAVSLVLYDMQGRKIETLYDGIGKEGDNDMMFNVVDIASGIYVVCMLQGGVMTSNVELIKK